MPGNELALDTLHPLSDIAQLIGQHAELLPGKNVQIFTFDGEKLHQSIGISDPSGSNDTKLSGMHQYGADQTRALPD